VVVAAERFDEGAHRFFVGDELAIRQRAASVVNQLNQVGTFRHLPQSSTFLGAVEVEDGRCFLDGDAVPVKGAFCFTVTEDVVRVKLRKRLEAPAAVVAVVAVVVAVAGVCLSENQ